MLLDTSGLLCLHNCAEPFPATRDSSIELPAFG